MSTESCSQPIDVAQMSGTEKIDHNGKTISISEELNSGEAAQLSSSAQFAKSPGKGKEKAKHIAASPGVSASTKPNKTGHGRAESNVTAAQKSEGVFRPKQVPGEQLTYSKTMDFESGITASVIHFHKLLKDRPYYFVRGTPTITQLLYESGPAKYMRQLKESRTSKGTFWDGSINPDLSWIHLPANNMSWVERLVTLLYEETQSEEKTTTKSDLGPVSKKAPKSKKESAEPGLLLAPEVWSKRQYDASNPHSSAQGRFMKPFYSRISTSLSLDDDYRDIFSDSDPKSNSVIFMPYIHWDRIDNYILRNKCLDWMKRGDGHLIEASNSRRDGLDFSRRHRQVRARLTKKNTLADNSGVPKFRNDVEWDAVSNLSNDAKLVLAYIHEPSPLHIRRTLDQSFYYTLPDKDIRNRDIDQVLYRYTQNNLNMKNRSRILMVDQLWIWIIDKPGQITKTIVTSFPRQWKTDSNTLSELKLESDEPLETDMSDFYERIFRALRDPDTEVNSVTDLVCLIIDKCSGLFHPRSYEADHTIDYLDTFAIAIGRLADYQTKLANTIWNHSKRLKVLQDRRDQLFNASVRERWFGKRKDISQVNAKQKKKAERKETMDPKLRNKEEKVENKNDSQTETLWQKLKQALNCGSESEGAQQDEKSKIGNKPRASTKEWFDTSATYDHELTDEDLVADLAVALSIGGAIEIEDLIETEMNAFVDITSETECMKEIKDIIDELNSISHNFAQQIRILKSIVEDQRRLKRESKQRQQRKQKEKANEMKRWVKEREKRRANQRLKQKERSPDGLAGSIHQDIDGFASMDDETFESKFKKIHSNFAQDKYAIAEELEDVEGRYQRVYEMLLERDKDISSLEVEATRVYKALCDLLDLKQKQASVSEAYSARKESKETARQGQTILLFTIVTIIFLPLSFIAGIYSMNAKEINGDSPSIRPISHIFRIMFPATFGVLVVSLVFAYSGTVRWFVIGLLTWNQKREAEEQKIPELTARPIGANMSGAIPTSIESVMPERRLWKTGQKLSDIETGLPIAREVSSR